MVETLRTIAEMQVLLADNATKQISAQDLRDLMATLRSGHGEITITTAAETTIVTKDVFVDVAGTFALSANAHNFDMNSNGQLRYTGPSKRILHVACTASFTSAGNNKIIRLAAGKNGTVIAESEAKRFMATGADLGSTAVHTMIDVANGDYITLMVANGSSTSNFTMETVALFAMGMAS